MGRKHLSCYAHVDGAEVVAVADVREENLKPGDSEVQLNIGAMQATIDPSRQRLYGDSMALIDDPDVDLVDICLPTFLHAEHAKAALRAGKHVLCEKPMAFTHAECRDLLDAAAECPGRLMIAHCVRFFPAYVHLKETVESGRLGRLLQLSMWRGGSPPRWSWEQWLLDHTRSGGAILDLHIHDADFVQYLLGRPRAVSSTGARGITGGYDAVDTVYLYDEKVAVRAGGTLVLPPGAGFEASFLANFGKGCLRNGGGAPGLVEIVEDEVQPVDLPERDGYVEEIAYFVRCIREDASPDMVSPASSAFSVRLVEAERESIESGQMVELD
jgi:predicted dehydrogenase